MPKGASIGHTVKDSRVSRHEKIDGKQSKRRLLFIVDERICERAEEWDFIVLKGVNCSLVRRGFHK